MKNKTKEEIKIYIQRLLNTIETDKEQTEIPNSILLLVVYMAGLQQKPFPLDKVGKEDVLDVKKELPTQFHTLIAQLAIKKSKIEQRTNDTRVISYLIKNMSNLLRDFQDYFKKQL